MKERNKKTAISKKDLSRAMHKICKAKGLPLGVARNVVKNYLDAELLGKTTHGITKFCYEYQFFSERQNNPKIILDTGALLKINGNREVGPAAAMFCIKQACQRAKLTGVSLVGVNNIQRYGVLSTWCDVIARNNMFGIIANICEPTTIGYEGKKRILGTNPIAYSIATPGANYVVDMATSKKAMSNIWQCMQEGKLLPKRTFLNASGQYTVIPELAKAVEHFGGVKGYAISLLVQMLTGSVFGFSMGHSIKNMYDIGYVFLVIDPKKTSNYSVFLHSNLQLIRELRSSGAVILGERGMEKKTQKKLYVQTDILKKLIKIAYG